MSKRSVFTTITPLPAGVTRETVMEFLLSHTEMIDLNPLVEERHPIKPPPQATPEEFHCVWYSLTDKISYLPGGMYSGKVTYTACFHDLGNGIQTHVYAPMGLDIKNKWTINGSLPGEPTQPHEIGKGIPLSGLYLREDVDMRCNILMTSFVKKNLRNAHSALVDRLVVKAQLYEAASINDRLSDRSTTIGGSPFSGSPNSSPRLSAMQLAHRGSMHSSIRAPSPGFPSSAQDSSNFIPAPLFQDPRISPRNSGTFLPGQVDPRLSLLPGQQLPPQPYNTGYDPRLDPRLSMQPQQPYPAYPAPQAQLGQQYGQNGMTMELENNQQSQYSTYANVAEMPGGRPDPKKNSGGPPVHPTNFTAELE